MDFLMINKKLTKNGVEVYPKFIIKKSKDLMIRGGDFYAIWDEENSIWSESEDRAIAIIDGEVRKYVEEHKEILGSPRVLYMWDAETGLIDNWHKYCQRQLRDNFVPLDNELTFKDTPKEKKQYNTKVLPYAINPGVFPAWESLISTLYDADEREKIEWCIGSIINGDSRRLQKFAVFYGSAGTGKSTILNIIEQLFEGYYSVFDAKALGSNGNSFALEAFRSNPLVAIQHDGDLSRIEDNTRLNSLVSHELMTVNEKFKSSYSNRFNAFLFMGTNKPVKITDAKSGLIRRLIDIKPTGNKLSVEKYHKSMKEIPFELGAIAYHCKRVYENDIRKYDDYIPTEMLGASNDFYNFIEDSFFIFSNEEGITLKAAWELYKIYVDDSRMPYPLPKRLFKEELKNYFLEYHDRYTMTDGSRARSYYRCFIDSKFSNIENSTESKTVETSDLISFNVETSIFEELRAGCISQYASDSGAPEKKWDGITTKLEDIDTSRLHYVMVPENHIVIDFDIVDSDGNKSLSKNIEVASNWPTTYGELSKSGNGVHLHYIYDGDVRELSRLYADNIEIKVYTGKAALRRKFTKCNGEDIRTISSGLPLREERKMNNEQQIKDERHLRNLIVKALRKEINDSTKPNIDFIKKILDDAYEDEICYDVSNLKSSILAFAACSSNQSKICMAIVKTMKFQSEKQSDKTVISDEALFGESPSLFFYDIEVFPNLFIVNFKKEKSETVVRMINPKPHQIEDLVKVKLVGFNCRKYDNHILYARMMGYSIEQLYNLSQKIINGSPNSMFAEAYNLSYADVYDFASEKMSLKKWQIRLGIKHQELGLAWDEPVPPELWEKVAEYCDNDVISTEKVFEARRADFVARQILADLSGLTVNDTTNKHSQYIIFGDNKNPHDEFRYRNMAEYEGELTVTTDEWTCFDKNNNAIFKDYKYEYGKSTYRDEEVGEGGYVFAKHGIHENVMLLDITSMHPSTVIIEKLFGPKYTKRFEEIVMARVAIKNKNLDEARGMLGGKLEKHLADEKIAKDLAQALKIVINSVYGLTAAGFDNPFRDRRNIDNIVAKRGALFMVNLKHAVTNMGYDVVHIKTDSIKIANGDDKILEFVEEYGAQYGYNFEHEDTYEKMCLVNNAVYICKSNNDNKWHATGTQFQVPYVFKKLFSNEEIVFDDLCETKQVTTKMYLDLNESLPQHEELEKYERAVHARILGKGKELKSTLELDTEYLEEVVNAAHDYRFVGKVGSFCPMVDGVGGGILCRYKDGKYSAVTGTSGYRWMESDVVEKLGLQDKIDYSYYNHLADQAIEAIEEYGSFQEFITPS